ncbi:unnamed protein product, partial [Mycena citricolor]
MCGPQLAAMLGLGSIIGFQGRMRVKKLPRPCSIACDTAPHPKKTHKPTITITLLVLVKRFNRAAQTRLNETTFPFPMISRTHCPSLK